MKDPNGATDATEPTEPTDPTGVSEFTSDWELFEARLASLLGYLAMPALNDIIRISYPVSADLQAEVLLGGRFDDDDLSGIAGSSLNSERALGVSVKLPDQPIQFFPLKENSDQIPEAALAVCEFLREDALVPHHSLLTAAADGGWLGNEKLEHLGLPHPGGVLREIDGHTPPPGARRRVNRGGPATETSSHLEQHYEAGWPTISWPRSVEETQTALEGVLRMKNFSDDQDSDGDYVVDTSEEGGTRFYLTVINDRPLIGFRKIAVIFVKSRQAAVIEANYLNREHADTRWVLRGHTLSQELLFPTDPFVPVRFAAMLNLFSEHYRSTVSSLRMRLGGDL